MKKLPALVGVLIGALIGLFTTISDELGLKIVMISIGSVTGLALGVGISQLGKRGEMPLPKDSIPGIGFSPEDRMATYWRDKGNIYPMPGHPDPEGASREPNDFL